MYFSLNKIRILSLWDVVIIAGWRIMSAFPWCSWTAVETKGLCCCRPLDILSHFHCRRSLCETNWPCPDGLHATWWAAAAAMWMQNKCIMTRFITLPRVYFVHWSEPVFVCLQSFVIQNTEGVDMINWVLGRDVHVFSGISWRSWTKEFPVSTKLLELFISLYGKCCEWN